MTELQALQNAVNSTKLDGLTIHEVYSEDRRKSVKRFMLRLNHCQYSPVLNYNDMTHFILGFIKALNIQ